MQTPPLLKAQKKLINYSFLATALVYLLTSFHHFYGATVYNTPWRRHVVFEGAAFLLLCYIFMLLYKHYRKKILLIIYLLVAFIVFGLGVGIFEGLYNHVTKDILYFIGLKMNIWRMLFPSPAYEIPNNLLFESTGILQFIAGCIQVNYVIKVYRHCARQSPRLLSQTGIPAN